MSCKVGKYHCAQILLQGTKPDRCGCPFLVKKATDAASPGQSIRSFLPPMKASEAGGANASTEMCTEIAKGQHPNFIIRVICTRCDWKCTEDLQHASCCGHGYVAPTVKGSSEARTDGGEDGKQGKPSSKDGKGLGKLPSHESSKRQRTGTYTNFGNNGQQYQALASEISEPDHTLPLVYQLDNISLSPIVDRDISSSTPSPPHSPPPSETGTICHQFQNEDIRITEEIGADAYLQVSDSVFPSNSRYSSKKNENLQSDPAPRKLKSDNIFGSVPEDDTTDLWRREKNRFLRRHPGVVVSGRLAPIPLAEDIADFENLYLDLNCDEARWMWWLTDKQQFMVWYNRKKGDDWMFDTPPGFKWNNADYEVDTVGRKDSVTGHVDVGCPLENHCNSRQRENILAQRAAASARSRTQEVEQVSNSPPPGLEEVTNKNESNSVNDDVTAGNGWSAGTSSKNFDSINELEQDEAVQQENANPDQQQMGIATFLTSVGWELNIHDVNGPPLIVQEGAFEHPEHVYDHVCLIRMSRVERRFRRRAHGYDAVPGDARKHWARTSPFGPEGMEYWYGCDDLLPIKPRNPNTKAREFEVSKRSLFPALCQPAIEETIQSNTNYEGSTSASVSGMMSSGMSGGGGRTSYLVDGGREELSFAVAYPHLCSFIGGSGVGGH